MPCCSLLKPAVKAQLSSQQEPLSHEHVELLKFFIGLRLLGEERQVRYLTYLRQLREADPQDKGERGNATGSI